MSQIDLAIRQLVAARDYTTELVDSIPASDWFRMPHEKVTHVAWQVGHLAIAEYALALRRIRGQRHEDERLISPAFAECFGRETSPVADPARYPSIGEIRSALAAVHRQVLIELPEMSEAELDQPLDVPHRICRTKGDALWWVSRHEMLHAGQIGLLRRLLGYPPQW